MRYTEIRKGMKVDYHSVAGGPVTDRGCIVTIEPWMMYFQWYCKIDSRDSAVLVEQLSFPGEKK